MYSFKQFMAESDALVKTHHHVGTCVNSFDEDGDNCTKGLPYRDVSHFANHEENAKEESKEEFLHYSHVHPDLYKVLNNKHTSFLHDKDNDVHMMYDGKKDIHHFYTSK